MTYLLIMNSINQVDVHSDSVKIFLVNVVIVDRIDPSEYNCVVSVETNVSFDLVFDVMYVME